MTYGPQQGAQPKDDGTLAANSDFFVPTQKAVKTYVDAAVASVLPDGDKGDIIVSVGGTVWTIDTDAVTYAKMQNVSAGSRLLGRGAGAGGDVEEITLGSGMSMSGSALHNSIGVDENGVNAGSRAEINFDDGTSVTFTVADDIPNTRVNISAARAALTGDVTASANSNATAFRVGTARSVLGTTGAAAVLADIASAANGDVLQRYNGDVSFQSIVGTSFPAAPYNGMVFFRTDLGDHFYWDSVNSLWLSVRTFDYVFTNQATVAAGAFLRPFQGPVGTTTLGLRLPYTAYLVEVVGWKNNTTGAAQCDIQEGATVKNSHTIALGVETDTTTGLVVSFASGGVVTVAMGGGTALTSGGGIIARFRRVAA